MKSAADIRKLEKRLNIALRMFEYQRKCGVTYGKEGMEAQKEDSLNHLRWLGGQIEGLSYAIAIVSSGSSINWCNEADRKILSVIESKRRT